MISSRISPANPTLRRSVRAARGPSDVEAARRLFREYRQWHVDNRKASALSAATLKVGLGLLDEEIASLPWEYVPPLGILLLAFEGETPVGCGALRELRPGVGEIKRVYVRASSRGGGLGIRITRALLTHARTHGYDRVRLDTLPTMTGAIHIYRKLGFVPIKSYWKHPAPGALFFEYRMPQDSPQGSAKRI